MKIETIMAVVVSQLDRSWFYYDRNKQYDLNKQTSLTQLKYTQLLLNFDPKCSNSKLSSAQNNQD